MLVYELMLPEEAKNCIKAISKVLKERFTNLSTEDTIDMAYKILEAISKEIMTR